MSATFFDSRCPSLIRLNAHFVFHVNFVCFMDARHFISENIDSSGSKGSRKFIPLKGNTANTIQCCTYMYIQTQHGQNDKNENFDFHF